MRFCSVCLIVLSALGSFGSVNVAFAEKTAMIYISFWFDTEDFILPEADDAAKRIAKIFSDRNIKATFKMVGEKVRVLEERGRDDVILALSRHDIGYHSTNHSIHPTPAEYCRHLDWHEGAEEFLRREGVGLATFQRVFGVNASCYGQPGGSWTPQSYAALREMGIPLYLDECGHVGLNNGPFWYCGILNVLNMGPLAARQSGWTDEDVKKAIAKFDAAYGIAAMKGGGIISMCYHPCEFVHQAFWDAVNFSKGANPPRSEWKKPPLKSPAEQEQAFKALESLLDHIVKQPEVRVVTAREIPALYPDRAYAYPLERKDLVTIAGSMQRRISYVDLGARTVSAAEALFALAYVAAESEPGYVPDYVDLAFGSGPAGTPEVCVVKGTFRWEAVQETARDLVYRILDLQQMPTTVWVAGSPLRPEDFAATIAGPVAALLAGKTPPENVRFVKGNFEAQKHVTDENPGLWQWVIFPEGFEAPRMMRLAKLQAWTIKPAVLRK